jgi:hypothetical protein
MIPTIEFSVFKKYFGMSFLEEYVPTGANLGEFYLISSS